MIHIVWTSERIAVGYFVYLAVVCWLRPLPASRRAALAAASAIAIAAIVWVARSGLLFVREWAPLAYILAGYYASGLLFVEPSRRVEAWLEGWDRRLLGDPSTRFAGWPRAAMGTLEVLYIGCFILIGAGFLVLSANGQRSAAERYWTIVTGAELGSFAPLAFIPTRPPWAIERKPVLADPALHSLATRMVRLFTIQANTFPSGHVAGSLAVGLAVFDVMPATGLVLIALAAAIAVATVAGRYHYVVDGVAGAALAVMLWLLY